MADDYLDIHPKDGKPWISSAPSDTQTDLLTALLDDAIYEAGRAASKYPQPNYVISKIAEEAGEVVKEAIHLAEDRGSAQRVRAEIVQTMAMLIRLYTEGDEVHGCPPIARFPSRTP